MRASAPLRILLLFGMAVSATGAELPRLALDASPGLHASQLAVVINEADPLSVRIGDYYVSQRRIPSGNVIRVRLPADSPVLTPEQFAALYADVMRQTPQSVQAFALTWRQPYRVACMSITTAFAAGFDRAFCSEGCTPTRRSPYFNSRSRSPWTDFGWRPTMALAAANFDAAKALIDRGIAADHSFPAGTAYLLKTSDSARSVRAPLFPVAADLLGSRFVIDVREADSLRGARDVMFYFTGLAHVPDIDRNRYLPGAIADHLTSIGGNLVNSSQMSALRWLEAGATASYGSVTEPCNFPEKFPNPVVVMDRYLAGETLIEAYWKGVAWPGQGIFIGEPLAAPFAF